MINKKFALTRFITGAMLIAALSYLAACAWLYLNQENLLFHPHKINPNTRFHFATPFDEIWIPVKGATLHGLYFKAKNPQGLIIFFHGNTQTASEYGDTANEFTDQGFDYFVPDYRGFGKSTGKIKNEQQFLSDADAIWKWALQKFPEEKISLAGRSMGGVPTAYLSSKHQPRLTLMISSFFNTDAMANIRYPFLPKFLVRYKFRNDLWVSQTTRPIFFVHGTHDQTVPPEHSEKLAVLAKASHRFLRVFGAGHGNLQKFPLYHKILYQIMSDKR